MNGGGTTVESVAGGNASRMTEFVSRHSAESPSNFMKCFYESDIFAGNGDDHGETSSSSSATSGATGSGDFHSATAKSIKLEPGTSCYQQTNYNSVVNGGSYGTIQNSANGTSSATGGGGYPGPMFSLAAPASPMFPQPSPVSGSAPIPDSTSFLTYSSSSGKATGTNGIPDRRQSDSGLVFEDSLSIKSPMTPGGFFEGSTPPGQPLRSHSVSEFGSYARYTSQDLSKLDAGYGSPATAPADSSATAPGSLAGSSAVGQKAFVPCKVCGDKASGYHYGVTSCEGCKGFFRRSIQKQIEYRCLRDGKCMVFRLNRNRCQYCRFKKCLAVGMSRDSVRYGRVPKRSRDRMHGDDSRVSSMTGDSEVDSELEKKQLALYDIILSVSQAHHSNCAYTDDKIKNLAQRPMHFPLERCTVNENDPMGSTDLLEQQKIIMWESMAHFTTPAIQRVVEFAKRIPGFTELVQDDQLILIKTGFFEVWLVRIARMFNPQQYTVTFSDGSFVTRDQLELIYNPELVTAMFNFSVSFNNLHLNDGEVGLFTAVVLLTQDRPGLNDPKTVEQLQEKLIEALKLQLSRSHSSDPQVFPNLLMKLSELRTVGAKHNEVLGWYRMNFRRLKLPPLYAEIYDIPKCEDQIVTNGNAAALTNGHAPSGQQAAPGGPPQPTQVIPADPPGINPPPGYPIQNGIAVSANGPIGGIQHPISPIMGMNGHGGFHNGTAGSEFSASQIQSVGQ